MWQFTATHCRYNCSYKWVHCIVPHKQIMPLQNKYCEAIFLSLIRTYSIRRRMSEILQQRNYHSSHHSDNRKTYLSNKASDLECGGSGLKSQSRHRLSYGFLYRFHNPSKLFIGSSAQTLNTQC